MGRPGCTEERSFLSAGISLPRVQGAIAWLADRGVSSKELTAIFDTNPSHIRQLVFRGRRRPPKYAIPPLLLSYQNITQPPSPVLRDQLGIREEEDSVVLDGTEKKKLERVAALAEMRGASFWSGVRFASGLSAYRSLLPFVGYPAHFLRIRLLARIRQLIAETYLHAGQAASALTEGLRSFSLSSIAYHESEDRHDLHQVSRTARLISQAFLLRSDTDSALRYLDIHQQVAKRLNLPARPEYFHQMGTVYLLNGNDDLAKSCFQRAMQARSETHDFGQDPKKHEVLDIGRRQIHFLTADWEEAQDLQQYMARAWGSDDIHVGINLNWTVATAFQTDSDPIQEAGIELLNRNRDTTVGFGHQITTTELLALSPMIPKRIRSEWARFTLYQNAYQDL